MALTPITLRSLPGSPRDFNIPLNPGISAGVDQATDAKVQEWIADTIDLNEHMTDDEGQETTVERLDRKRLRLRNVVINREIKRTLDELKKSMTTFAVTPPWVDAVDPLTYLPLQDSGFDMRFPDTRGEVAFARESGVFNPVTGERVARNVMLHTDGVIGKHLHVGDYINNTHWPSMVWTFFLTRDASDSGSTTLLTVTPADAVLIDAYDVANDDIYLVSTQGESSNTHELFEIDSINTTTGVITASTVTGGAASAALAGTSDYTKAKRAYLTAVSFVSDAEMDDSGMGSWEATTPAASLVEKNASMHETGSQCLRIIGGGDSRGVFQTISVAIDGDTDLAVWVRARVIRGTMNLLLYEDDTPGNVFRETTSSTSWIWLRYAFRPKVGAGVLDLRLYLTQDGATEAEFLVNRAYIFKNQVANGGMEGAYDDEQVAEVVCDIAPDWNKLNTGAGDSLDNTSDVGGWSEHGGAEAQYIDVGATLRGIRSAAAATLASTWYLLGAFFEVASGAALIASGGFGVIGIDDTPYAFRAAVGEASGANQEVTITADGGAAEFAVDDVMAIKLMGNPFDDAILDLSEPLETTGFTVFGFGYVPNVANTALDVDAFLCEISRYEWDNNAHVSVYYDESTNKFHLDIDDGATTSVSIAETFSAGDLVCWAVRCDDTGAAGDVDIWIKVNQDATVTDSDTGADILSGLSRMWIGRTAAGYEQFARGSVGGIFIENTPLSDATILAMLEWFAGDTGYENEHALLEETHGIVCRIHSINVKPWSTARGDMFKGDINLIEVERVGSLADRDAN